MNNWYQPYTPPTSNGINWVSGIEGAKAWQLQPNSNVILLDSERDVFYIKTTDNIGMSKLRIFSFTELDSNPTPPSQDMSQYVTKEELDELKSKVETLIKKEVKKDESVQSTKQKSKLV